MRLPRLALALATAGTSLALLTSQGAGAVTAGPIDTVSDSPRTYAIIGDTPYGAAKLAEFPALVAKINADPSVELVAHLGDIKNGSSRCDDSYFATIRNLVDTFQDPFVYTPGDNEWTDCHRTNNGGYFPPERLDALRRTFFPVPGQSLGVNKKQMLSQASDTSYPAYVENTLWMESKVVYSALNLPGSNNDLVPWTNVSPSQAAQQQPEFQSRLAADVAWMYKTFSTAIQNNASGVVLLVQADMWDPLEVNLSGYDAFLQRLAGLAHAFGRPVLMLEGDSHGYRVDNPLTPTDPLYGRHPLGGLDAPNFTRVVVQGSAANPTEYLRLTADPSTAQVFSWVRVPL